MTFIPPLGNWGGTPGSATWIGGVDHGTTTDNTGHTIWINPGYPLSDQVPYQNPATIQQQQMEFEQLLVRLQEQADRTHEEIDRVSKTLREAERRTPFRLLRYLWARMKRRARRPVPVSCCRWCGGRVQGAFMKHKCR